MGSWKVTAVGGMRKTGIHSKEGVIGGKKVELQRKLKRHLRRDVLAGTLRAEVLKPRLAGVRQCGRRADGIVCF